MEKTNKILTDSSTEKLEIKWDGTRFGLIHTNKATALVKVIIISPKEMLDLIGFGGTLGLGDVTNAR